MDRDAAGTDARLALRHSGRLTRPRTFPTASAHGREYAARDGRECAIFTFLLGTEHPVYEAVANRLPRTVPPYA